jgi:hypothetical protein
MNTMRTSSVRSIRTALAIFLMKMRLGLTNRVLSSIFHIKNKQTISRIVHQVCNTLVNKFVPHYLGLNHIDRKTVLNNHQTSIATKLFTTQPDQICIVMDGTYIYIEKSSNNAMQRRTYSFHKHRHLIKPMIITATVSFFSYCEIKSKRFLLRMDIY